MKEKMKGLSRSLKGMGFLFFAGYMGQATAVTCQDQFGKTSAFVTAKASVFNSGRGYAHSSDLYGGTRVLTPSVQSNNVKSVPKKNGGGYKPSVFEEKAEYFKEQEFSVLLK